MIDAYYEVAINPSPSKGEYVLLFSGESQTEVSHLVGPSVLDYHLIHVVIGGKGSFRIHGHQYELKAGDSFVIFPGELFTYEANSVDPWQYRWIALKGNLVDIAFSQMGVSANQPIISSTDNRVIPTLFHQIKQTLQAGSNHCDMQANGYFRLLLAEYMQHTDTNLTVEKEPQSDIEHQIELGIRFLTLQYTQPISIEQLAHTVGYHRTYYSKMFKQHTGLSPVNFLLKIRMERAKLLLSSRLTIEQISSSVGFTDPLYFSKQYKKWYGVSPSESRSTMRGNKGYNCKNG